MLASSLDKDVDRKVCVLGGRDCHEIVAKKCEPRLSRPGLGGGEFRQGKLSNLFHNPQKLRPDSI